MNVCPETRDLQIPLTSYEANQIHPKELTPTLKAKEILHADSNR